mmetsp:Transcript_11962/g.21192  ORF Transcript_11962/g.21192 Transcript_11962/m.21192 type:complete len:436 (-) Transcript_11962:48-1355(-)
MVSGLALADDNGLAAMGGVALAVASAALYQVGRPYRASSTNTMAASASLALAATYLSALVMQWGAATGERYGEDTASGLVLLALNGSVVPLAVWLARSDAAERAAAEAVRLRLYDKLRAFKVESRKRYDLAWQGYVNQDPTFAPTLLSNLRALQTRVRAAATEPTVRHAADVAPDAEALLAKATVWNTRVHDALRPFCEAMGAREYKEGPVKSKDRVLEKTANDYGGDVRQVVDVVRSSAVFHSLHELNNAVEALADLGGEIRVVRVKDRLNKPQGSGYRDVMLNLTVRSVADGLVVELQLHLRDIILLKDEEHRIYELLRTLGWENDEVDAELLTSEEQRAARRSQSSRRAPQLAIADGSDEPDPEQTTAVVELEQVDGMRTLSSRGRAALETTRLGVVFHSGQRVHATADEPPRPAVHQILLQIEDEEGDVDE